MGASGAVGFVYRQQLGEAAKKGEDVDALRLELQQDYEDTLVNPYIAAERGYVDAVIPPSHTVAMWPRRLRLLERKITQIPPKQAREHSHCESRRSGHRSARPRPTHQGWSKGEPTVEELAAGDRRASQRVERSSRTARGRGEPVGAIRWTGCRYTTFSWQRVTLQERTHMRK